MKITRIEAIPVDIPTKAITSSLGTHRVYEYAVVIVHTDEEIVGLGEVSTLWDGTHEVQCAFIRRVFEPALVGCDPTDINRCLAAMDTLVEGAWPARAAVEMALFDIAGKALGVPAYKLLGGKFRESIALSRSIGWGTPSEMAEGAAKAVAAGNRCVKAKVGNGLDRDVAGVRAIREAIGPDVALRVDANMAWTTPKAAITAIHALEPYQIHSVEQPIPVGDLDALRRVRDAVSIPIMLDESVWGPHGAWDILRAGAADMLNVYVAESGGLTNSALIFRMAAFSMVPCAIGSMPELGIGTAAAVALGIAMPNLADYNDACGSTYQVHDVVNEQFDVANGEIRPFETPGLGVTLDMAAIARFRSDGR
jgi:L-alanine-DL-glutamate epimerase-like enolase superfamily enzyme